MGGGHRKEGVEGCDPEVYTRGLVLIHFTALSGSLPPHLPVLLSVPSPPPSFFVLISFFIDQPISPVFKQEKRKTRRE